MIGTVSSTFTSALHNALNSRLLLFQHAHPEIPVAAMRPVQALDVVLVHHGLNFRGRFWSAARFLKESSQELPAGEIPETISRVIEGSLSATASSDEAMIQGVLKVFREPLKKVLERFQAAEPIRTNPNQEAAWQVYGDWLLEQGDPRGEVIQLERAIMKEVKENIKLERVTKGLDRVDLRPLKARKRELERRISEEFVLKWDEKGTRDLSWRNGYFEDFEMAKANRDKLSFLFESEEARFLRKLTLSSRQSGLLLECLSVSQLNSIVTLHLNAYARGDDLANFIMESSSNNFRSLKHLTLYARVLSVPVRHRLCNWARERGIEPNV